MSIALVSEYEMRRVRRVLRRGKKYRFGPRHALNVLSFLLDKNSGEILLGKDQIQKEAKRYKQSFHARLLYLYIHGLLHLKGYDHQSVKEEKRMRREEEKFFDRFYKNISSKRKIKSLKPKRKTQR